MKLKTETNLPSRSPADAYIEDDKDHESFEFRFGNDAGDTVTVLVHGRHADFITEAVDKAEGAAYALLVRHGRSTRDVIEEG
jgi:hypothetical protein